MSEGSSIAGAGSDFPPEGTHALVRALWDLGRAALIRLDGDGRCVAANRASARFLGVEVEALVGKAIWEVAPVFGKEDAAAGWSRYKEAGGRVGEFRREAEDGRVRVIDFEMIGVPATRSHVVVLRDLTDRLRLERELGEAQRMEAIGRLAGGIAHDFNNILTVIQGHAALLQMFAELPEPAAESAQQIFVAAERAATVTRQLLTFSRRQVMQPRDLDLGDVILGMAKMLQRVVGEEIAVHLHLPAQLPRVHADQGMLEQVVMSLAVNARDAMPRGGQLILNTSLVVVDEAEARKRPQARSGRFVQLGVADTGCGIAPENLSRIFEPFFTTKEVGRGTGLGLATVHGIVQQHQGWVEVSSEVGRGTVFAIHWPVAAGAAEAMPVPVPARGREDWILVVEDEAPLRALVRSLLERQGYRVLEAGSGAEALRLWPEHRDRIRLLLTDMVMPDGVSGRELGTRLQTEKESLRVIYTSGYGVEVVDPEGRLREGFDFLQKPYHPRRLAEAVRARLGEEPRSKGGTG